MRALAAIALVAACGGGEGGGLSSRAITAEEAAPFCMAQCARDIECQIEFDLDGCTTSCQQDFAGWARGDAVEISLECLAEQVCTADDDVCFALVQPLAIHEEWETACRANLAACIDAELACEVSPSPLDEEIGIFRFIAPEIMPDLIGCLGTGACQDQLGCVEAELEANGINF